MPNTVPHYPAIERTIRAIDRTTTLCGHAVAWLLLLMVLLESAVVLLRYGFDIGSIALQESVTYVHAAAFLLGAAYTLQCDEHVRVDIFYRRFSAHRKAAINLLGFVVFLLPVCLFIIWESAPYVAQAWRVREASADSGGLAGVYWLKSLIPLFAALLILQGSAEAMRAWLALKGITIAVQEKPKDGPITL
ncbi:MAG: TRAP transporter small permease subunit [Pseudomonadales bacterium]|nr:TRAP transporter small permease subunit [Pseudomonadales bacterium]